MMRWLKDKKKEKRSNSSGQEEDGKEDDYGFGKEKVVLKSPSSRRELPPPPAAPEEKSPHIYEEIPDLPLCCASDAERACALSKALKDKSGNQIPNGATGSVSGHQQRRNCMQEDEINPYMIVSVDKEVRQTPTNFHRNGTPEVHCDVIVKDTHCEILLTRKPKIGTFQVDKDLSGGENVNSIRNNTHFCLQDRHTSVDCLNAGKPSYTFSTTSPAFTSLVNSKVKSVGELPSLSSFSDHQQLQACEEIDNASGIVTYTVASNFIPRSTKLTFNPLPGKDPCVEAFGKDPEDEVSPIAGFSSTRNEKAGPGASSASYSAVHSSISNSATVTYALLKNNDDGMSNTGQHVMYSTLREQHCNETKISQNHCYIDEKLSLDSKLETNISNTLSDNRSIIGASRTGVIRAPSPSSSSTCTYASVTFPTEPKHYSTIPELISPYLSNNDPKDGVDEVAYGSGVIYSIFQPTFAHNHNFSGNNKNSHCEFSNSKEQMHFCSAAYQLSDCGDRKSKMLCCTDFHDSSSGTRQGRREQDSTGVMYSGIQDHTGASDTQLLYMAVEEERSNGSGLPFIRPASLSGNNIELDFCSCSDEHTSSCGCSEMKHNQDDDVVSTTGTTYDGPSSCKSCGRLIRQITYSESYSDETYEHVYASRLLIRKGRRFSSPDITLSEISHSEFQDIPNSRSPDVTHAFSRDDSWASLRSNNAFPPAYNTLHDRTIEICKPKWKYDNTELSNRDKSPEICHDDQESSFCLLRRCDLSTVTSTSPWTLSSGSTVTATQGLPKPILKETNYQMKITNISDPSDLLITEISPMTASSKKSDFFHELCSEQTSKSEQGAIGQKDCIHSGIFSKQSKTTHPTPRKQDSVKNLKDDMLTPQNCHNCDKSINCISELGQIPEKNTKRLSKFFQCLSNKGVVKESLEQASSSNVMIRSCVSSTKENLMGSAPNSDGSLCKTQPQETFHKLLFKEEQSSRGELQGADLCNGFQEGADNPEKPARSQRSALKSLLLEAEINFDTITEAGSSGGEKKLSSSVCDGSNAKIANKTDSGDTCYEYDISTSSEGEQNYECFLSKVKRSLNLEHEVDQIAESTVAQRKAICKCCQRDGLCYIFDGNEGSAGICDGLCPHLMAKLGDLRSVFEDLVIDHRAAILDCLTTYTHSPYSVKGHSRESHCRECGCVIQLSDAESLTTVYNLLSHQFRVTSPSGQMMSCDSDEGTMADNSCESADEDAIKSDQGKSRNANDGNSSGFDEPGNFSSEVGSKKSRLKDKKSSLSDPNIISNSPDQPGRSLNGLSGDQLITKGPSRSGLVLSDFSNAQHGLKDMKSLSSEGFHKIASNKSRVIQKRADLFSVKQTIGSSLSLTKNMKNEEGDNSRSCDASRTRASMISDKMLQDIYSPLPAKALSQLTSRNFGSTVTQCTCGKVRQASEAAITAHFNLPDNEIDRKSCVPSVLSQHALLLNTKTNHGQKDHKFSTSNEASYETRKSRILDQHSGNKFGTFEEICPTKCSETECVHVQAEPQMNAEIITFGREPLALQVTTKALLSKENYNEKPENDKAIGKKCVAPAQTAFSIIRENDPHTMERVLFPTVAEKTNATNSCLQGQTAFSTSRDKDSSSLEKPIHQKATEISLDLSTENTGTLFPQGGTDKSKFPYNRRHRLELSTLDLLPETAVDGDANALKQTKLKTSVQPKRSKAVEKMARIFESHGEGSSVINCKDRYSANVQAKPKLKSICSNNKEKSSGFVWHQDGEVLASQSVGPAASKPTLQSKENLQEKKLSQVQDNVNVNSHELSYTSLTKEIHVPSKPHTAIIVSVPGKGNEAQEREPNGILPMGKESKRSLGKVMKKSKSSLHNGDARMRLQKSPTPSSSSASSSTSSSLKKKGSDVKHKKTGKKSYQKRSKSRSERSRRSQGREEQTCYYYFSSDFSDIDVIEVEDWESYATSLSQPSKNTPHKRPPAVRKKRAALMEGPILGISEKLDTALNASSNKTHEVSQNDQEQEVYSIPPSSAELRQGRETRDTGTSPQPSPDIAKTRKGKRTDVYKTKKSNNKLLSDLIIRNYDMQVYSNV